MSPFETLLAAAACAGHLMQSAPVLPDLYLHMPPGERCPAYHQDCDGVFYVSAQGQTVIIGKPNYSLLIHESCHAIQHDQDRALSEPECYAIQARAGGCFIGMGVEPLDPLVRAKS